MWRNCGNVPGGRRTTSASVPRRRSQAGWQGGRQARLAGRSTGPVGRAGDGPGWRAPVGRPGWRAPVGRAGWKEQRMGGQPLVSVVMGSDSDWPVMQAAVAALAEFGVDSEADVVSAHRMPHDMISYGAAAAGRGLKVIIAGAGGAAHLPGMLAAVTPLPVIGVPVPLAHLDGMDSLLSIVQMPAGIPVATVAVGGARNAGLLAVRILAASDEPLRERMVAFQRQLRDTAQAKGAALRARLAGGDELPPGS